MLKVIPQSDISIKPFKAYKSFSLDNTTSEGFVAFDYDETADLLTDEQLKQKSMWHQLYTMYYRDPQNPFTTYGDVVKYYPINEIGNPRLLKQKAFVFPILQKNFGEQIKPGSVSITLEETGETLIDDGFGNLISNVNSFNLIELDNNNSIVYYYVTASKFGSLLLELKHRISKKYAAKYRKLQKSSYKRKILEIGCGTGMILGGVGGGISEYIGFDIAEEVIESLKIELARNHSRPSPK